MILTERSSAAEAAAAAVTIEAGGRPDWLSSGEAGRARALAAPKRRRDWLAGRLAAKRLVRRALAKSGRGLGLDAIEIATGPDGSPSLRCPEPLADTFDISISHSAAGGLAALARGGARVGADLERLELRGGSFVEILAHPGERSPEVRSDAAAQARLWTLKEAVLKLLRLGLSADLWDVRLVGERLELAGKARARWEALGRPAIAFETRRDGADILSLAYTTAGDPDD